MVFSSLVFLFYFLPISIIVYFALSFSIKAQNVWLFLVSLFFYAWGEPIYVFLMLGSIVVNWLLGLVIGKSRERNNEKVAKIALFGSLIFNLGSLVFFKYLDFIIDNINAIAKRDVINNLNMVLPIGISFFTFQAMSYVTDVYRKDAEYQKNPFYMGLYISFFPQLVAGPIVRYNTIEQLIKKRKTTIDDFSTGINRFAIGLIKKILLANNIAVLTDTIFELIKTGRSLYEVPALMAWIGGIGYMLHIYYDFSAYSDMAIGLGRIFGFRFEENFNYPYVSKSIGEFWRRWHISLGTWFKEYVYIPLGGSRVENQDLMVKNTLIVWLLTGIWHGSAWTFVLWGLYSFIFIMFERVVGFEKMSISNNIKRLYVVTVIFFGWILFRVESLYQLREVILDLFMCNRNHFINDTTIWIIKEYWLIFLAGILFSVPTFRVLDRYIINSKRVGVRVAGKTLYLFFMIIGLLISIMSLVRGGYNPFIYFNF